MNICEPFIRRPVATTLLTIAVALAGGVAFRLLPVSPLPRVDLPTISVGAALPGGSPETMASSVATPLERQLGFIAGITQMTSSSSMGAANINLQFDLNRDIDAAARDVQAAINAARSYLPSNLPNNPTYRKVNSADSPIMIIALTSKVLTKGEIYDAASTVMSQKMSQITGVGQVIVGGSALPAVRIELNPLALNKYGVGITSVAATLSGANANSPKGHFSDGHRMWEIGANDQLFKAAEYEPLIVSYNNGAPIRVKDVARVVNSVEDLRNAGYHDGNPAVLLIVFRQPGANIIETVDKIKTQLPQLAAAVPKAIDMEVAMDQTTTIRASVHDVERTLLISVMLVILVVFIFLRSARSTLIPSVAVPVSLIGTFAVMYLLGYSVDNFSLMALTISTGFVVDDAIVVVENITRYLEQGMPTFAAALKGAQEIGFTVMTISLSLIAVFLPLLLMGGIVGRLFREFSVTLSVAIVVSMLVSLTTTPMMCAYLLKEYREHGWLYRKTEAGFNWMISAYEWTLIRVLRHPSVTLLVLLGTIALNIYLFVKIPKGFFPQQDTGRMMGIIQADQDSSFQTMDSLLRSAIKIIKADPAVAHVDAFTGGSFGGTTNTARMFINLKPLEERRIAVDNLIARLRPKLGRIPGGSIFLVAGQDIQIGARMANAQYQFTLQGDNLADLMKYAPLTLNALRKIPILADVNSDQQNHGLKAMIDIDRASAARFAIPAGLIDSTLYNAFGQSQISTMYAALNQYHVVMEAAPEFLQTPEFLRLVYVKSPNGGVVPLPAISEYSPKVAPLSVNHQGVFPAVTISFNLPVGVALGDAVTAINSAGKAIGLPPTVHTMFAGAAEAYQSSLASEPLLIGAALGTVYIVLGILYESYIHPITILSTLPSAGIGALLALMLFKTELTIIAVIGIILLIGIVKKNAIMMIDFAVAAERNEGKDSIASIYEACLLRFRPILMTTAAAILGALPLALGKGTGSELRRPLGITIIGGLVVSQLLTLYTTPVVYLFLDRIQRWIMGAPEQGSEASRQLKEARV